jgi:hypothetical protein
LEIVESCAECRRLSSLYEGVTIEWFRVQGQLGVADHLRDETLSDRIVAELTTISKRRRTLREAIDNHILEDHPQVATA